MSKTNTSQGSTTGSSLRVEKILHQDILQSLLAAIQLPRHECITLCWDVHGVYFSSKCTYCNKRSKPFLRSCFVNAKL